MRRLALALALIGAMVLLAQPVEAAPAVDAGWKSSVCYTHTNMDDPLVFPGQHGASHEHDFVGANNTDADSTPNSVRAGGTCSGTPDDTASYWVPGLITQQQGRILPSTPDGKGVLAYYFRVAAKGNVVPFPDGFSMILGNAHAMSVADNVDLAAKHIFWKCGPGANTRLSSPPSSCAAGRFLVEVFTFPQFWTGHEVAGNDIGEMSYRADAAHPVALPRLSAFWRYSQATGAIGSVSLTSGPFYTIHMDFWSTWVQSSLASLVTRCINGNQDCGDDPTP